MAQVPPAIQHHRNAWTNRGQQRPPFAIEPGPGQESVWDYPRPPALVTDDRPVVIRAGDLELASTTRAIRVLETASPPTFYLPPADVRLDLLAPAPGSSMCEWKGTARYWALAEGSGRPIAWAYPDPFPEFAALSDYLAFYPGRVECTVDGIRVQAQPGDFYGGWITPEIVGPFKGDPGTTGW